VVSAQLAVSSLGDDLRQRMRVCIEVFIFTFRLMLGWWSPGPSTSAVSGPISPSIADTSITDPLPPSASKGSSAFTRAVKYRSAMVHDSKLGVG
jgi:hypothetical protein